MESKGVKPKLTYFDIGGRAESIRLAFCYGGIEFEDYRVPREEWPKAKPSAPWGTIPFLDVSEGRIGQSAAILRYVGRKAGLYPKDDFDAARVDDIGDGIEDIIKKIAPGVSEPDPEKKKGDWRSDYER